jgi:hypothetical protein
VWDLQCVVILVVVGQDFAARARQNGQDRSCLESADQGRHVAQRC